MRDNKKSLPILENLQIIDVGSEGNSVGKANELVVFVDGAVPGDNVNVQLTRKKKNYGEGKITKLNSPSIDRIDAFCEHFNVCGGCKWQNMKYEKQLFFKQKQVVEALTRIGKMPLPEISQITSSKKITYYRNKLEYTFSNKMWLTDEEIKSGLSFENRNALGFHIPKLFDKILDIKKCYLQSDSSNTIRNAVKAFALKNKLTFYDIRNHTGLFRNLIIRTSTTAELMVILCFGENLPDEIKLVMEYLKTEFAEITSLLYIVNLKKNDTIRDQVVECYSGRDHIFEEMEGLKFKISAKSFYQTNSEQAYELYKVVRNYAQLKENEIVYDLYTGTGTIANFVARNAKKVVGIEYIPDAIEDAKINSSINNITNTSFYAGDIKDTLTDDFIKQNGKPHVIITDPPRAGMHEDVVKKILEINPQKIVYVSCNPATQARDMVLLNTQYTVMNIQPVDMFPHTHHVENVVLLERN